MSPTVSSNKLLRNFTRSAHWAVLDRDAGKLESARLWARTAREWLAAFKLTAAAEQNPPRHA